MIIHFNEVSPEGQTFYLDRRSGELNGALQDLIGQRPYTVDLEVMPLGQSFDVKGSVKTELPQVCSLCADEFTLKVNEKFHQIAMDEEVHSISGFKENWSAEDVEVWVTKEAGEIDVGDIVHEALALAQPTKPICKEDCKGLCLVCGEDLNVSNCNCAEQQKTENSPFSVLKKLKLN
ncbi:MAG: DUF177 domain-containing protein [Bdellovibrionales bacterium]